MKKKWLTLLATIGLASCNTNGDISGIYSFSMGKPESAHIGVYVNLTNEAYQSVENAKKFTLSFDYSGNDSDEINDLIETFHEILGLESEEALAGYYYKTNYTSKDGTRIALGTDILDTLLGGSFNASISSEIIEQAVTAYIDGNKLTIRVPVSGEDLLHQLTWYGCLININASEPEDMIKVLSNEKLPGEKDAGARIGTRPLVDDYQKIDQVSDMNTNFEEEFSTTHLFDNEDILGSFVTRKVDGEEKLFYISRAPLTANSLSAQIKCGRYDRDVQDYVYDVVTPVTVEFGEQGEVISVKDEHSTDVSLEDYFQTPYKFREFHTVGIALKK